MIFEKFLTELPTFLNGVVGGADESNIGLLDQAADINSTFVEMVSQHSNYLLLCIPYPRK